MGIFTRGGISFDRLLDGDPVVFAPDSCLIVRRAGMSCGLCRDACPAGVLSGSEYSITLEGEGCVGCGLCAAACPTGALMVEGCAPQVPPTAGDRIVLECRRVGAADRDPDSIVLPCLGGLATADLLDLVAGVEAPVVVADRGWCADCPVGRVADPWRAAVDETRAFLRAVDAPLADGLAVASRPLPANRAEPVVPALRPDKLRDRRALLRGLIGAVEPRDALAESRRVVFGRGLVASLNRRRILDRIRVVAAESGGNVPASLMPAVKIADGCDLNGVCAAICPTGALRLGDIGDTISLEFDSAGCIACGECQRVCPSEALSLWPEGDGTVPEGPIELVARQAKICAGCGDRFVAKSIDDGGGEVCPFCRKSMEIMQGMSAFRSGRARAS
jgi:NAD-dependent dihydropyrimidine dehydrogenase PreA subunit